MQDLIKQYVEAGKQWLGGATISEFQEIKFTEPQRKFLNSKARYSLIYGGFASGKTLAFIAKMYLMALFFPGNKILVGGKTRSDVELKLLPEMFSIFPQGTYNHRVQAGMIDFPNGSQILIFGLDALQSGAGQDIKKAEQRIKSLNLGAVFIDQLEEIEYRVFEQLSGRLRRNVPFQQMNFTCNPANFWAYDYFVEHPRKNTAAIKTSMLDNAANLSKEFLDDQMSRPKLYVEKFVKGNWSPEFLVEGLVFSEEYIKSQIVRNPIRIFEGIKIFEEPTDHIYQIGVDPSTAATDPAAIVCVDTVTGETVATFSGYIPNEAQIEKTVQLALMYSRNRKPLVVPESTGVGQAFIEGIKKVYDKIYEREVFSEREKRSTRKLGFQTSYATKIQLVEHMKSLFERKFPKIRDQSIITELQTFIWSDEAQLRGAGAQHGYHDDLIMAMMLAYFGVMPVTVREKNLLERYTGKKTNRKLNYSYV